jgi:hypothetical protein
LVGLAAALVTTAMSLTGTAALAAPTVAPASQSAISSADAATPNAVDVPMTLDCVNMTAKARAYAVAHEYCPSEGGLANNTVYGNCGSSWIYIHPWGYAGEADVSYGFSSSKGTVIHRALYGYWDSTNGLDGSWSNIAYMASSRYSTSRNINAGRGTMYATVDGVVTLWWGGQCYLLSPYDRRYVS